ncbi:SRPBCC domain-containing protein [Mucilaginibacter sp. BJC16-A38]|uniref:SRPBCC domain-containing protein n=1 Tax=Mucilaginibacter phenanthrenivorans TaxID=1234842 RepID=UPI002157E9EF|nr:SRPBCC domain-containing protein [Mucilaginibacter phenanthrenivorans]MCR8558876.1 SRPBCC domain-containing protein [Mucilaginibacter phenanthrenivorans]
MSNAEKTTLTAQVEINAPIEKVWALWTTPEDIMQWNNPDDTWHTPRVENDLRPFGKFLFAMALKDGSLNFDFTGTYDEVITNQFISYTLNDGRHSAITFIAGTPVKLVETFEPNDDHPHAMQQEFCQAVLDGFKKYVEGKG